MSSLFNTALLLYIPELPLSAISCGEAENSNRRGVEFNAPVNALH
jgi:hypothetical protein